MSARASPPVSGGAALPERDGSLGTAAVPPQPHPNVARLDAVRLGQAPQRITVLGSTGSVGVSTLDVIARHPGRFEIFALTAARQVDAMLAQCARWQPRYAVMADPAAAAELSSRLRAEGFDQICVRSGSEALSEVAAHEQVDAVMAAIVGAAGLAPCLAAARAGKRLMLANKEALVVGAELFMQAVAAGGATLLPIDSEHSAVFQALPDDPTTWTECVDKIILTASGGPFRTWEPARLRDVTPEQACAHPNWVMGRKISVDSATMMNKALEVIEAHHLFGLRPQQLQVVIHPQSVIHSMVQFHDSSVVAQLGTPDMRVPIAYGLSWPERIASGAQPLDFSRLAGLSFEAMDTPAHMARFPGLCLAWDSLAAPAGTTAVLNAANEVGVAAFLERRLRFDYIHAVNQETLASVLPDKPQSLSDLLALDERARHVAAGHARRLSV